MLMLTSTGESTDVSRRIRLTDDQLARTRAILMCRMKVEGYSSREIAKLFRLSAGHVNLEIRAIPDATRRRIERNDLGQVA